MKVKVKAKPNTINFRERARRYYLANKEKKIAYQKKYNSLTNYAYDKKQDRYAKQIVRWKIRNLFKSGKIKKDKCKHCGSIEMLQFHHSDYNEVYNFIVLCKKCHLKEHKEIGYRLPIKKYKEVK